MKKTFALLDNSVKDLPIEDLHKFILNVAKEIELDPEDISDGYHTFYELYEFRKFYNAALFNEWAKHESWGGRVTPKYKVHKSKRHNDGELCFGGGWFVVVAELPTGQITNHYKEEDWHLFQIPEYDKAYLEYDGHSAADARNRLLTFLESTAIRKGSNTETSSQDSYLKLRRRSGKTTRAVDKAIQTLFKEGKILIPYSPHTEDRLSAFQRGTNSEISIVRDPDWSKGETQKDFMGILRRRLRAEHHGKYEEEINPHQYVLITLLPVHNS